MPTPRERWWAFGFLAMSTSGSAPATVPLLTAEEMAAWDRSAIEAAGVPERVLMENAGRAAAAVVAREFPCGTVVGVIGSGKNGGDGVVMLRTLAAWGRDVVAVPAGGAPLPSELLAGWEIPVADDLATACRGASVIVDAVLGTGARGAPRGDAAAMVHAIASAGLPVVALDGPTGVDLTDGSVAGDAVQADLTISFGAPKRGLVLHPGRGRAGRILVVEIGFPPLDRDAWSAGVVTAGWAAARLPRIPLDAHKGTAGEVSVVAGGRDMGGAAVLVAMGALRAGAGMVRVISAEENRSSIQAAVPEAVFVGRDSGGVEAALERADAVVIGPGIGLDDEGSALVARAIAVGAPIVLDADALTLLAREPGLLTPSVAGRALLTPHPGEMARLLGTAAADITADPFGAAREAVARFGCAVLLKGAPSHVAAPDAPAMVNVTGHSGIATGGMGDTLAGIAGAMMAGGASPADAGALALYYSGRAAELAGRGRSLLPRDVSEALPAAFAAPSAGDPPEGVILELPAPQ